MSALQGLALRLLLLAVVVAAGAQSKKATERRRVKQVDLLEKLIVGQRVKSPELVVDSSRIFDAHTVFKKARFPREYSFIIRVLIETNGDLIAIVKEERLNFALGVDNGTLYIDYQKSADHMLSRLSIPALQLSKSQWLEIALGFGNSEVSVFLGCEPRAIMNISVGLGFRTGIRPQLNGSSLILGYTRTSSSGAFQGRFCLLKVVFHDSTEAASHCRYGFDRCTKLSPTRYQSRPKESASSFPTFVYVKGQVGDPGLPGPRGRKGEKVRRLLILGCEFPCNLWLALHVIALARHT
jgi:hypothetical protein